MLKTLVDRFLPPAKVLFFSFLSPGLPFVRFGNLQQSVGRIVAAVEHGILDSVSQLPGQILIDGKLACIDDTHIHSRTNRVVEKHGMDSLAYDVVAAKRKRHVADPAADHGMRQRLLDLPCCLNEVESITVVFLDPGCNSENVRVEDDVGGIESNVLSEDSERALANLHFAFNVICLTIFVECHDNDGGTVVTNQTGLAYKFILAFLEADRVDDALALCAAHARFDHRPLR